MKGIGRCRGRVAAVDGVGVEGRRILGGCTSSEQVCSSIPVEIEQAGLIDGCSRMGIIWRITLPLAIPALISVAIYAFMIAWNEFLYAFIFLNDRDLFTMPIKINTIFNDPSPRPHVVMAASTIMTIPIVTLFLAMERYLAEGLTAGGVKG